MPIDEPLGGEASANQDDFDLLDTGDDDAPDGDGGEADSEESEGKEDKAPKGEEEGEGKEEEVADVEELDEDGKPKEKEEKEEEEDKEDKPKEVPDGKPEAGLAKSVKAKYPNLFKEFPDVRRAIYRDQQFAEIVASPEEAKELVERAETFDEYERDIMEGKPDLLLKSLADTGDETLTKFALNFLPTVEKFSPELRGRMIFPYVRRIFLNAQSDAKASGNKNLEASVQHMSRYLWNSINVPEDKPAPKLEDNPEAKKLKEENQRLHQQHKISFDNRVIGNGLSQLRSSVNLSFKKDERFTKIELDALADKTFNAVRRALDKDPRHARAMQSLWAKAKQSGYPEELVPRLVNAFLGGAKNVLPAVRARIVAEALKTKGIKTPPKGEGTGGPKGAPAGKGGTVVSSKQIDYEATSDEAIMSGDPGAIKLKKAK